MLSGLLEGLGRRRVDHDARERYPVMGLASCDPLQMAVRQHIHPSRLVMVVHVENQSRARAALLWQNDHRVSPVPLLHQAAYKAQVLLLRHTGLPIRTAIVLPAACKLQRVASCSREHDAAQAHPAVILASRMPCHMAVRVHIHTARLGMVVEVEDQPLLWSAAAWQHSHRLVPVASSDQALDLADVAVLCVCWCLVLAAIGPPC